jgi:hypothetical protein
MARLLPDYGQTSVINIFYRAHARFVAADMTDTGSQQLVYPPIIMGNS